MDYHVFLLSRVRERFLDNQCGRQTPDGKVLCGGCRRLDADEGLDHEAERVSRCGSCPASRDT